MAQPIRCPLRLHRIGRRIRRAALAPQVRLRVGRGTTVLQTTSELDGSTRLTLGDHAAWQFEIAATWGLEKLVFNPEELRLVREVQRVAARREKLIAQVAAVYTERRRLLATLVLAPPTTPTEQLEAHLRHQGAHP